MLTPEEIQAAVLALWDREGGWIPGCAREQLADALGLPAEKVRTSQQLRRDGVEPGYLEIQ